MSLRQRLERRDVDDLGRVLRARRARAARTSRSRQTRNAASVLPEPVGAAIRTSCPGGSRASRALRLGGLAEARGEPARDQGVESLSPSIVLV